MKATDTIRTDVVIVGAGVAGLSTALHAEGLRVALLTKSEFGRGGASPLAQGGVAAAVGSGDSPEAHAVDTISAGAGLCDPEVVRTITTEGPWRIAELVESGARFDRVDNGAFRLGREGGHRRKRIVHAAGDATGAELVRTLVRAVAASPRLEIFERRMAMALIVDGGRVIGVRSVGVDGRPLTIFARHVVLASGGIGQVFVHTTNPLEATGDGLALAAAAGARLAGLEFVQFHPTALAGSGSPLSLLTEALRGEGAVLVDDRGVRFMPDEHPMAELAPRDIVARAIDRRRRGGGSVFLDATGLGDRVASRFPTVAALCSDRGLDPASDLLPVVPAAHYHMGGIVIDLDGRTSVPGLWACGEVAHTGLHGANRLASNSLLEALVVGSRCGEAMARTPAPLTERKVETFEIGRDPWMTEESQRAVAAELRRIVEDGAGVVRTQASLRVARERLEELKNDVGVGLGELDHLVRVGGMILRAAEARTESRGAHFRADIPWSSPCWRQDLIFEGETLLPPRVPVPARRREAS